MMDWLLYGTIYLAGAVFGLTIAQFLIADEGISGTILWITWLLVAIQMVLVIIKVAKK